MPIERYRSLCEERQKIIVSKDKKHPQEHRAINDRRNVVTHYRVDGVIIKNEKACDFLLINEDTKTAYLIELKGGEVSDAVTQLNNTVRVMKNELKNYPKKYPTITVAQPNGGVKEQVAGIFAQKLAELGYTAVAADAAYQGESRGIPLHADIPFFRTEDIHGMVDLLTVYPGVDKDRIGLLGICGGAGYTLNAAKSEKRAKAVAVLSMFN